MMLQDEESDEEALLLREEEGFKPKEDWNIFVELPPDKDTDLDEDRTVYNFILQTLKLVTYAVVFVVVLGASVVSKLSTVLMTSQLRNDNETVQYCHETYRGSSVEFLASSSVEERISWVWALYFCFMLPEAQSFLRGLRIIVFKGHEKPKPLEFFLPFVFETLHTIGLAILVYLVLPTMDAGKAAMLANAMCLVPGVFGMLSRGYEDNRWVIRNVIDVVAILLQITSLFVWPLFSPQYSKDNPWLMPLSIILISFGWWENFVETTSPFTIIKKLGKMKMRLRRTRYFTYAIVSVWKMAVFLAMLVVATKLNEGSWSVAFSTFTDSFQTNNVTVTEKRPSVRDATSLDDESYLRPGTQLILNVKTAVLYTMATQMISTYICYVFGKVACRILIQAFSYSFPVLLTVPVTLTALVTLCGVRNDNVCFWESLFPGYLWWSCPQGSFWQDYFFKEHTWAWLLWLFSQTWITIHIWSPKGIRLARTESVFATPMYNAFMVDQTLALNRRRDEAEMEVDVEDEDSEDDAENDNEDDVDDDIEARMIQQMSTPSVVKPEDWIPKIFACATMWHENKEEMIEMLKSIFRMDADQCARRLARKMFEIEDPSYYEFETHIFFDDAFQLSDSNDADSPVKLNSFVRDFIGQMEEAATHVHQVFVKLRTPKKVPTPYGGRLEWVLPGRTRLICHLKDKNKIRHKKRWSQVMYMYYLLGYKLTARADLELERKEVIAENTFLLALDGDIDFQPKAVELLVDLMRKNRNLGAACGRIHPIGGGAMVWYQKFEYAVGHWFQKATEHVFGCVLCSPGCFSLFRAKALMDYNVARKYTTMATEPIHYVQYDQGEDRWLCTLLLQRGWRVEYSAASDAYTHAPEGFREFYNQRRRWAPSTMANIMDLLMNGSKTVKQNPDISYPYIMYQMFLMVGSILGPGTIFLMLVGAFAVAFKLDQWDSFLYNFIPILLFILACYFFKSDIQLAFAEILTTIYALAMVAVVVAIVLQISDDGLLAPSTLFLIIVAGSFVIAGIVHPLEFWCLPHGFLYYITIPSMYLLLMIYSLFNLNNVSWGTREGPKTKTKQELEAEKAEAEQMAKEVEKKKKKGLLGGILPGLGLGGKGKDGDGSLELSCAGLFKVMCCVSDKPDEQKQKLDTIVLTLGEVSKRLETIEKSVDKQTSYQRRVSMSPATPGGLVTIEESAHMSPNDNVSLESDQTDSDNSKEKKKRDDLVTPFWMEDKELSNFSAEFLTGPEVRFWRAMIDEYLLPIDADKGKEKAMAKSLKDLRNKVAFTFIMCNAVFVVLIFLLQLEKEKIHINWPFGAKTNVTYRPTTTEVEVNFEYLELEPIGLVFVGVFGLVLGIQFIGMMIHRLSTFLHIMALTEINFCNQDTKTKNDEDTQIKEGIGLIRKLQRGRDDEYKKKQEEKKKRKSLFPGRRKTIADLERTRTLSERPVHDLARNVSITFADQDRRRSSKIFQSEKNRQAFERLKERRHSVLQRRHSVLQQRRKSTMFGDDSLMGDGASRSNSLTPSIASNAPPPPPPPPPQPNGLFRRNSNARFQLPRRTSSKRNKDQFEMRERKR